MFELRHSKDFYRIKRPSRVILSAKAFLYGTHTLVKLDLTKFLPVAYIVHSVNGLVAGVSSVVSRLNDIIIVSCCLLFKL